MQQVQAGGGPPDPAQFGELLRQFQGGRGGAPPDWQRLANSRAFGNGRQSQRPLYNGMALFSLDDYVWDARNYSVTGASVDKPAYANARYGVTFGGPLQIPKLLSASKRINFTLDFQLQRNRTGINSQGVNMPTALERTGDFSQTLVQGKPVTIYDPTTGQPFTGNVIPLTRLNPAALALLNYFPNPNVDVASRNYQTSWTNSNDLHNLNFRLSNIRIGSKDRLNGSFGYQGSSGSHAEPVRVHRHQRGPKHERQPDLVAKHHHAPDQQRAIHVQPQAASSPRRSSPMAITLPRSWASRARRRTPSTWARPT